MSMFGAALSCHPGGVRPPTPSCLLVLGGNRLRLSAAANAAATAVVAVVAAVAAVVVAAAVGIV